MRSTAARAAEHRAANSSVRMPGDMRLDVRGLAVALVLGTGCGDIVPSTAGDGDGGGDAAGAADAAPPGEVGVTLHRLLGGSGPAVDAVALFIGPDGALISETR